MKTITLTDEQHLVLKGILDREIERWPHRVSLQGLWHACAKTAAALTEQEVKVALAAIEFARGNAEVSSYEEINMGFGTDEEVEALLDSVEKKL